MPSHKPAPKSTQKFEMPDLPKLPKNVRLILTKEEVDIYVRTIYVLNLRHNMFTIVNKPENVIEALEKEILENVELWNIGKEKIQKIEAEPDDEIEPDPE